MPLNGPLTRLPWSVTAFSSVQDNMALVASEITVTWKSDHDTVCSVAVKVTGLGPLLGCLRRDHRCSEHRQRNRRPQVCVEMVSAGRNSATRCQTQTEHGPEGHPDPTYYRGLCTCFTV